MLHVAYATGGHCSSHFISGTFLIFSVRLVSGIFAVDMYVSLLRSRLLFSSQPSHAAMIAFSAYKQKF